MTKDECETQNRRSLAFSSQAHLTHSCHRRAGVRGAGSLLREKGVQNICKVTVETIWSEQTNINHPVKYSNSLGLVGHRENNV